MNTVFSPRFAIAVIVSLGLFGQPLSANEDLIREIQRAAVKAGKSPVAHWGTDPENYTAWGSHSNRLVPVYTYGTRGADGGADLDHWIGAGSRYRTADGIAELFPELPENTVQPDATYCDQTDLALLQMAALEQGRKHIFLVVFDGMDWPTTHAAALWNSGSVEQAAAGHGLHFLDYDAAGTAQRGSVVTSTWSDGLPLDVNTQTVSRRDSELSGGYDPLLGGRTAWEPAEDLSYLIGKGVVKHVVPDSAATATAFCAGVKTYNGAICVDATGQQLRTVAHMAQERGMRIGAVSSVPISHATPAAAYAHNVSRNDYQDLSRDLLGLPSVSHPEPLPGLDVLIGGGFGDETMGGGGQGENFVPGNRYLAADDLAAIDVANDGRYVVAVRQGGANGRDTLSAAAQSARDGKQRLFGFYGVGKYKGHLPFRTADGGYDPAPGRSGRAEEYAPEDLAENPTLADMTEAAITVLSGSAGFWLMVEAGDVDWANHDDNLDNSIGAVLSGDAAVKVITDWVEQHSNWDDSLLIVTADHGHMLVITDPSRLVPPAKTAR